MRGYREVFAPAGHESSDPGRIFYTITPADVGHTTIKTTAGPVHLASFFGRVLPGDVGKRLYRVPCDDPAAGWIWQAENDAQQDARLARES
jgi:hypothetical protein